MRSFIFISKFIFYIFLKQQTFRFIGDILDFYSRLPSIFNYDGSSKKSSELKLNAEKEVNKFDEETIDENSIKKEEMRELFGGL